MFYSYFGVYQANITVWNGTIPSNVVLSKDVTHPLGLPVEIATLVLTNEAGDGISTLTTFIVYKSDLMERLVKLDEDWTYVSLEQRSNIFIEIVDIDSQWPYAPP